MKHKPEYLPSPKEIKLACSIIRNKWSEEEIKKRSNSPGRYSIPVCDFEPSLQENIKENNIYRFS